ncbi:MAG: tetratricopeptide repeat protein [Thermoguttaceae bacterium]|nr:tetratricopeptide repeat protein [Thermoguttaceae bacterium]MDW8078101.1 tetratricopeptide repeat protein [Thermoguttaceae bacterium]
MKAAFGSVLQMGRQLARRPWLCGLLLGIFALALAGGAVFLDWWLCLPPDAVQKASYVGSSSCRNCHEKEWDLWMLSDHARAMGVATAETVLGDFANKSFTHIALEDIPRLTDTELAGLVEDVSPVDWAYVVRELPAEFRARLIEVLPPEKRELFLLWDKHLKVIRPCDVVAAAQRIAESARKLQAEGRLSAGFAVTSRLFREGGRFYVTTDNREGKLETFEVRYVLGIRPLQQYLVEFPDGRVQCLPLAWDTEKRQWFHLYPKERIPHTDPLHWTRPLQNWNYMCGECHTTGYERNFELPQKRYRTTWIELGVGCETCHGPGSVHVELAEARSLFWDRRVGFGLPSLKGPDSRPEINTCAPCHARRQQVYPGFRPGSEFLDHYLPELLDGPMFYPDGQILEEDFEYTSFLQSLMYRKGVRCSNCHDPHALRFKTEDPFQPRPQVPDNRVCGQCHLPSKYDTVRHHFHPNSGGPGTQCVDCHMPETTYMVVDSRRDHKLDVPRPHLTMSLGIPNACNLCHNDPAKGETAEWAAQWVEKWYGGKTWSDHFAYTLSAGREGKVVAFRPLATLARRRELSAIVRSSAILLLANSVRQEGTHGEGWAAAVWALDDPEPLVRWAAVRTVGEGLSVAPQELERRLRPRLGDTSRLVRMEAARILSSLPRKEFARGEEELFQSAIKEYLRGQQALADQPAAHLNMGVVFANLGDFRRAEEAYQWALKIDPMFIPARNNLAILYDRLGRKAEAEHELRQAVQIDPLFADGWYSLGLLLGEDPQRLEEAADCLKRAADLRPEYSRIWYNYGVALFHLGKLAEAETALKRAAALNPQDRDIRSAIEAVQLRQRSGAKQE